MRSRSLLAVIAFAACGGGTSGPPDTSPPVDARSPDATPIDAPPPPLTGPASIGFGDVEALVTSSPGTATIKNQGALDVTLTAITVDGRGFDVAPVPAPGDCAAGMVLAGGATCAVRVTITGAQLGAATGTLHVTSAASSLAIPLGANVLGRITATFEGSGAISATGLPCSTGCDGLTAAPVTLTATANSGSLFAGWSWPGCATDPTCVVAPGVEPAKVRALFIATQSAVHIEVAGNAPADVGVVSGPQGLQWSGCRAPCTVQVVPGPISIYASSPSTIAGLSGACTTTGSLCSFTIGQSVTATVTITANRDAKEKLSLLLPDPIRNGAVDHQGHLLVNSEHGGDHLRMLDTDGTLLWEQPTPGWIALGPNDELYASGPQSVERIGGDGHPTWFVQLLGANGVDNGSCDANQWFTQPMAVAPNGDLALESASSVYVYAASGSERWHDVPIGASGTCQVAFDAHGNVGIGWYDASGARVYRWDGDGHAIAPIDLGAASFPTAFAFDLDAAGGALFATGSPGTLARVGATPFTRTDPSVADATMPLAAIGASDDVWWAHAIEGLDGYWLHHYAPDGTAGWSVIRAPEHTTAVDHAIARVSVHVFARTPAGDLLVAGEYHGHGFDGGFVQVFTP